MIYNIEYVTDVIGNNYLGIDIKESVIKTFLDDLKDILGEDDYVKYTSLQQNRDHNKFHITLINVGEYNKLSNEMGMDKFINSLDKILEYPIDDLTMLGIGTATRNENRAYFIVCKSEKLNAIRQRYGLGPKDLHITLGFLHKDVFNVRKNEVMEKGNKFLKLLSQEFFNKETWNFIKRIENYNLDLKEEVIPIKLSNSMLKVKCDGYFMDIQFLSEGEKFWIVTKYPVVQDLPRLPETEILRILKKR